MKKIALLSLILLFAIGVSAKPYDHSLGVNVLFHDGLSYKTLVTEHFAVQTDVGFHFTIFDDVYGLFTINPNFMYQGTIYANSICDIDWFAGGGLSLGFGNSRLGSTSYKYFGGEFGLNTISGIEFAFNKALALSFDFRPGYGMVYNDIDVYSFFDWGFAIGMRFYL